MSYGLIGIGDNLRGLALSGLGAMTKEEQEREIFRAQMEQAEDAQRAQLLGTGTGIGGAYLVSNPEKAKAMWTGTKNLLGLGGSSAAPVSGPALNAGALNAIGGSVGGQATGLAAAGSQAAGTPLIAGGGNAAALNALGGASANAAGPTGMAGAIQSALAAPAVTPTSAAIAADVAASGAAAAEIGAGTAAVESGVIGSAGANSSLAAMAGPLAIGVAGLFLLNELFDIF